MKRWISVLVILVILAACARQQPTAAPTAPDQPLVGKLLVPIQGDGVELLVTEVTTMEVSSGKHNFLVSFELTNLDLDQYRVTKDLFSFSDGVGGISKPGLFNVHAPEKTNMDEYVLKRGETQPFAVGVFVPSAEGLTFIYQASATTEPLRVALIGAPANAQSRFAALDLAALAAPQSEFSQSIQIATQTQETSRITKKAFAAPERYLNSSILNNQEELGSLNIYVYDDVQNNQIRYDNFSGFYATPSIETLEQFATPSFYSRGLIGMKKIPYIAAGFIICHATVSFFVSSPDLMVILEEEQVITYLEQLHQRLKPVVCD